MKYINWTLSVKWHICVVYFYLNLVAWKCFAAQATPSDLYLGLYNKENTNLTLTVFQRDNFQHGCVEFPSAPNREGLPEECKYYGDCCRDPMRIREKLEPGTFSCQHLPSLGSFRSYLQLVILLFFNIGHARE